MKQYESYKPSETPWIGDIPSHWKEYRIKYNTFLKGRIGWQGLKAEEFKSEGYCLITGTDFDNNGGINWETCYRISKERFFEDELLHVKDGDILLTKDGTVGKLAYLHSLPEPASLNSHLLIVRQKNDLIHNSFLYYALSSSIFKSFCSYNQTGSIMNSISQEMFSYFNCFAPPIEEQEAIVAYLKEKCGNIDKIIAAQEQRIELLGELKQSIITEAVTHGLNPDVPMKDSGIDWIGKIPEHWDVRRIKTLSPVKRGASPRPIEDPKYFDENGEYSWVRIADVSASEKYLYTTEQKLSQLGASLSVKRHPGDIFISIAGTVGKPIITQIKCCIHDGFVWFPNLKFNTELLYYIFMTGRPYLGLGKMGTQLNLNTDTIGCISIPVPPKEEQNAIVKYIESMLDPLNSAVAKAQREIELLKELKQTTITEAVTGKVKVF